MSRLRTRPPLRRRVSGDDGFGLLETVVAMLVLSVVALAVLSMLATAQKTAYGNRARVVAANLAASEMDFVRVQARDGLTALPIGIGRVADRTVAGTTYTVDTTVEYVNLADPDLVCGTPIGVQKLNAVRVNVAVTWAQMGSVQPVTSDTMISPAFQDAAATTGTVVVRVVDRSGGPVSNATVTVGAKSAVTTAEGCAILTEMPPGTTTVTVGRSGYISEQRTSTDVETITVVAGAATNAEARIDRPARLTLRSPSDAASWPVPTTTSPVPLRLYNAEAPGAGFTTPRPGALNATTSVEVTNIFPYTGGYQVFAGTCAVPGASGTVRTAVTEPNGNATVDVPFGKLDLVARRAGSGGAVVTGRMIAVYTAEAVTGCSPAVSYQRGASASSPGQVTEGSRSHIKASLPTGQYDVELYYQRSMTGNSQATEWRVVDVPDVVVDAGSATAQVVEVSVP